MTKIIKMGNENRILNLNEKIGTVGGLTLGLVAGTTAYLNEWNLNCRYGCYLGMDLGIPEVNVAMYGAVMGILSGLAIGGLAKLLQTAGE
jgi:hypothetical protein